jgi:hypothetical protein
MSTANPIHIRILIAFGGFHLCIYATNTTQDRAEQIALAIMTLSNNGVPVTIEQEPAK